MARLAALADRIKGSGASRKRLISSIIGPVATAGSNFAFALVLIPLMSKEEYGFFALALVLLQLSYNVSNALCSIPMSIEAAKAGHDEPFGLGIFSKIALVLSLLLGTVVFLVGAVSTDTRLGSALAGLMVTAGALRWYGRSIEIVRGRLDKVVVSDALYSGLLLAMSAAIYLVHEVSLPVAASCGVASLALSSMVFFRNNAAALVADAFAAPIRGYLPIWNAQSRWGLMQILLMEATANAHTYLVYSMRGPAAYAGIAVAVLIWRPMSTAISSLSQVERPRIARQLARSDQAAVRRSLIYLYSSLLATWTANLLVLLVLLETSVSSHLPDGYSGYEVLLASSLWTLVMLARSLRLPSTVYCQAANAMKPLAFVGVISGPCSVLAAFAILLVVDDPAWCILGIVAGELVQMLSTIRLHRRVSAPSRPAESLS